MNPEAGSCGMQQSRGGSGKDQVHMKQKIILADGTEIPALGQGTWYLGEKESRAEQEKEALCAGIMEGMTLIDTAEMYGDGKAEMLVGQVVREVGRENLFLVSKVYPHHAGRTHIFRSCEASLRRMGIDCLDLYLLHWRGRIPLAETVECMEQLKKEGKIRRWGVSNFDTEDMKELWSVPGGRNCSVNQVLYHMASRGIEYDLLPWMRAHQVALMAYCPLAQGGDLKRGLYRNKVLLQIAGEHHASVAQILLAFAIRDRHTAAIPRSGSAVHARENAGAGEILLTQEDLKRIDREFPAPERKVSLDMQ